MLDNTCVLHELQVDAAQAGTRLDVYLEGALEGCSRSLVARCVRDGRCTVEPGKAKPGYRLRGGERVAIEVPELEPLTAVPESIPLCVLHENEALIVIDKPPGMVVHPAIGHPRGTLVNALLGRWSDLPQDRAWRPGLIHRLDADTSGAIAVAKTPAALQRYQDAFRERRVGKTYLALVHGSPASDVFEHRGWLARHPRDFRKRTVVPDGARGGRDAHTGFVVRERGEGYSVVECRLHTGRTHQIRVHLADLGHPVLADRVYGRSARWPLAGAAVIERQALHAWRLALPHAAGSDALVVHAPLPGDMSPLVSSGLRPLVDAG